AFPSISFSRLSSLSIFLSRSRLTCAKSACCARQPDSKSEASTQASDHLAENRIAPCSAGLMDAIVPISECPSPVRRQTLLRADDDVSAPILLIARLIALLAERPFLSIGNNRQAIRDHTKFS